MKSMLKVWTVLLSAALLSGCTAAVVGGVATGATVVHDRRTTGTFIEDKEILIKALQLRNADEDLKQRSNLSIDVYNLQVLLTGQAEDMALVERFRERIKQIPRVRNVFNEVQIGAEGTWSEATADAYLTTMIKMALFGVDVEGFDPTRVKVTTSLDTVYLMGLVTRAEANAVTEKVRYISGVKRVVRLFEYVDGA